MKKIIGIIAGLIVLAAIICGIFFAKGNIGIGNPEPSKEVMTQIYENYLDKVETSKDEDIYNNLLSKDLRDRYTLEQISLWFDDMRKIGKIKNFDKNSIEYSKENINNKELYVVSSTIEFEHDPGTVNIMLGYENKELKIYEFNFTHTINF